MNKKKLSSEQLIMRNLMIGFFTTLLILFSASLIALFKTLISYPKDEPLPIITIENCYDGDTCTTTEGEKIRLACIDTPELRGKRADPLPAKQARDYLNGLIAGSKVSIRRITEDKYGRTVAEISKDGMNIQKLLVKKGLAEILQRYRHQCDWAKY